MNYRLNRSPCGSLFTIMITAIHLPTRTRPSTRWGGTALTPACLCPTTRCMNTSTAPSREFYRSSPGEYWRSVAEPGCWRFGWLPIASSYWGTDLSGVAVRRLQELKRSVAGVENVTLLHKSAHDFDGIEPEAFDAVVINSVAQYFPSIDYLVRVLEGAVQRWQPAVPSSWETCAACRYSRPIHLPFSCTRLPRRFRADNCGSVFGQHIAQEQELVIDPAFSVALSSVSRGSARCRYSPNAAATTMS